MSSVILKGFAAIAFFSALIFGLLKLERSIERRGYDLAKQEDALVIERLKSGFAQTLAQQTLQAQAAEIALQKLKDKQELQDATNRNKVQALSDRLRTLADADQRLRDPHAGSCASAATSAADHSAANAAQAGGLLSSELSGLLQRLTREADDINAAYASCRPDAYAVRGVPETAP